MFKDLGLKSRVLLLSLLPSSVLALALGGYFTWTQLSELQAQLLQRGQMVSSQLAVLAAPALAQNQPQVLALMADDALEQADVRSVWCFAAAGASPKWHSWVCVFHGSYWPETGSWPARPLRQLWWPF